MPQKQVTVNLSFLEKVANFSAIASKKISELQTQLNGKLHKEAQVLVKTAQLKKTLRKTAEALYNSDFLNDSDEKESFIKRAQEDPIYLAEVLTKVCSAADVALIGSPAQVRKQQPVNDPVYNRAFGKQASAFDIVDR